MESDPTDDIDSVIERRVKETYGSLEAPQTLVRQIDNLVHNRNQRVRKPGYFLQFTGIAIACCTIVALSIVVSVLALSIPPKTGPTSTRIQLIDSLPLSEALVSEFATFTASGRQSDITSTDPIIVKNWFRTRLNNAMPPNPPYRSTLQLTGGRICQIKRDRVASYTYLIDATTVALYVTPVDEAPGSPSTKKDSDLSVLVHEQHSYATWTRRGWRYSLVAELSSQRIAEIAIMMANWQLERQS